MTDLATVIGIITSILGVIDGINATKPVLKTLFNTSLSLRAELVPVLGKLTAFGGVLRGIQLEYELDEADSLRLQILNHIDGPLQASAWAIGLISKRIDQIVSAGGVSLSFDKFLDRKTTNALYIIDQIRFILALALNADQM